MHEERQTTYHPQTILLFVFTAGVSLNNGLKTYLAALFTNGRKFFSIKYFLIGVILPAALMWAFADGNTAPSYGLRRWQDTRLR